MRPHFIQRCIKSRSVTFIVTAALSAIALVAACIILAPHAIACGFSPPPDKSAEIKLSLAPGVDAAVQVSLYEMKDAESSNLKSICYASAYFPLSAFPSTSNRYGTHDIAAAVREQVDAWELNECEITLYYENDTKVDLAEHELCVQGTFAFEKGNFWSTDSESYCWDPVESERFQNLIAEEEADVEMEVQAEEEILANAEWQTE